MLLDSNILIYSSKAGGEALRPWTSHPSAYISIISRIEALGFHKITPEENDSITTTLAELPELALDDEIATRAIALRQQKSMSLGDSIIAATALTYNIPLCTRNKDDFKHITELEIINPFEASTRA